MADWFADEEFWTETYAFEFPDPVLDAGVAEVDRALALGGVRGGAALDLGCGPGRHAVPLARRGFRVTAVDLSAFHLAKAHTRAQAAGVSIELVRADMRTFVRADAFDLAVSLFTTFGYFEDAGDDLRVLERVHRSLRPGGVLVLDVVSRERLARVVHSARTERSAAGARLIERHEIVGDGTRVHNEWTVVRDGRARTFEFVLRVYSGPDLEALLAAAGFTTVRLYGALDGRPYDDHAERLVAVAQAAAVR
jgi:SAM-dependent methyltransferase